MELVLNRHNLVPDEAGTRRGGELVLDEAQSWYRMKLVPEEVDWRVSTRRSAKMVPDEVQSWYQKRCGAGTRRGAKMVPDGAGTGRGGKS
jgi:hypothetical protein